MGEKDKISFEEFQAMLLDLEKGDEEIRPYLIVKERESGPFSPVLGPNPEMVEMTFEQAEAESAMSIGNGLARFRRQLKFKKRKLVGSKLPVIVAEGDSWFQFPILIDEVIDHLEEDFQVWCVSAAGDTAQNMVFGQAGSKKREYMDALRREKDDVSAFLFSGAGNDIIGQDENGNPVISSILKNFHPGGDPSSHINHAEFGQKLAFLKNAYGEVISEVRGEAGFEQLPIIVHGYDHAIPGNPPGSTQSSLRRTRRVAWQTLGCQGYHRPVPATRYHQDSHRWPL